MAFFDFTCPHVLPNAGKVGEDVYAVFLQSSGGSDAREHQQVWREDLEVMNAWTIGLSRKSRLTAPADSMTSLRALRVYGNP